MVRYVKTHAQYVGKDADGNAIYDPTKPIPTLKFRGTVKLHGTNAGIVYDYNTKEISYQSRERVLSLDSDNAGFMAAQILQEPLWVECFEHLKGDFVAKVAVFGEWCGQGIQKGVGVSQLPKMFVIFAVKFIYEDGESEWAWLNPEYPSDFQIPGVYDILDFPTWEIDIDFNQPELAQNRMIEITQAVEAECPVAKHFGVSGIGEGVVWTSLSGDWDSPFFRSGTWFKVKGEKHCVSKVKTLAAVDVEAAATLKAFIESVVTEERLEQGLDNLLREQLKPFDITSMGDFIRWVYNDVLKEESDTIEASGLDPKKLGSPIANMARPWFIKEMNGC